MNALAWRCIFLTVLLVTGAGRILASSVAISDNPEALADSIVNSLALQGFSAHRHSVANRSDLPTAILFAAEGCDLKTQIIPAALSLQEHSLLEAMAEPDYARYYIYLGSWRGASWPAVTSLAMQFNWLQLRVAAALGFRRSSRLDSTVLFVAAPLACNVVSKIDWRAFWNVDQEERD